MGKFPRRDSKRVESNKYISDYGRQSQKVDYSTRERYSSGLRYVPKYFVIKDPDYGVERAIKNAWPKWYPGRGEQAWPFNNDDLIVRNIIRNSEVIVAIRRRAELPTTEKVENSQLFLNVNEGILLRDLAVEIRNYYKKSVVVDLTAYNEQFHKRVSYYSRQPKKVIHVAHKKHPSGLRYVPKYFVIKDPDYGVERAIKNAWPKWYPGRGEQAWPFNNDDLIVRNIIRNSEVIVAIRRRAELPTTEKVENSQLFLNVNEGILLRDLAVEIWNYYIKGVSVDFVAYIKQLQKPTRAPYRLFVVPFTKKYKQEVLPQMRRLQSTCIIVNKFRKTFFKRSNVLYRFSGFVPVRPIGQEVLLKNKKMLDVSSGPRYSLKRLPHQRKRLFRKFTWVKRMKRGGIFRQRKDELQKLMFQHLKRQTAYKAFYYKRFFALRWFLRKVLVLVAGGLREAHIQRMYWSMRRGLKVRNTHQLAFRFMHQLNVLLMRLQYSGSIKTANFFITRGLVRLNGLSVYLPSTQVQARDVITLSSSMMRYMTVHLQDLFYYLQLNLPLPFVELSYYAWVLVIVKLPRAVTLYYKARTPTSFRIWELYRPYVLTLTADKILRIRYTY